jgi:hypothetical protein
LEARAPALAVLRGRDELEEQALAEARLDPAAQGERLGVGDRDLLVERSRPRTPSSFSRGASSFPARRFFAASIERARSTT